MKLNESSLMVINGVENGTIRLNFRNNTLITKWRTGWRLLEFCEITVMDKMDSRGKMEERGKQTGFNDRPYVGLGKPEKLKIFPRFLA